MRRGDEGKWLAVCSAGACLVAVPPLWPGVREAMINMASPGISSTFVCVCAQVVLGLSCADIGSRQFSLDGGWHLERLADCSGCVEISEQGGASA